MIRKVLPLLVSACLLESGYAMAAVSQTQEAKLQQEIQKVTMQTEDLQAEVKDLKTQLRNIKKSRQHVKVVRVVEKTSKTSAESTSAESTSAAANIPPALRKVGTAEERRATFEKKTRAEQIKSFLSAYESKGYPLGNVVHTSPFLSLRSAYDASDLVANISTMNEDLRLLQARQQLENDTSELGVLLTPRPIVTISGGVEGQASWSAPYQGKSSSDIDLTRAEFDTLAEAGKWATAFMSFIYDNSPLDPSLNGSGDRTLNSRVLLRRGFVTIGNLNELPLYFTIGQMYAPFGIYTNNILSTPQTKILGRLNVRAALLGYSQHGIYASTYAFNGPANVGNTGIDDYGANLGYQFTKGKWSGNFGGGMINDLADAEGIQINGNPTGFFQGFAENPNTEMMIHHVPAGDLHGQIGYGPFAVYGEYITATKSFDPRDMTFDNDAAKPKAGYAEGDYNFTIFDKPTAFSLAFGESWDALAIGVPKDSYIAAFNISIWKNTIESLEYRHDVNYEATDSAGGRCGVNGMSFCGVPSLGSSQNSVIGQIGVYF